MPTSTLSWFRAGTVDLVNGSAVIAGTNTDWTFGGAVRAGDIFTVDQSQFYEILSVDSDTQITLASNYLGTTLNAQLYAIIRNFAATPSAELVSKQMEILADWQNRETELGDWQVTADSGDTNSPNNVTLTNYDGTTQVLRSLPQVLGDVQRAIDGGNVGPTGPAGSQGDPGEGIEWQQGGWSPTHGAYAIADAVAHGGDSWVCVLAHDPPGTTNEPGVGINFAVYWELLAQGAQGIDGSKWFNGDDVPSSGLADDGDYYVRNPTGDFYNKIAGTWQIQGQIAGPTGPEGPSTQWFDGTGVPSGGLGTDGDYYLNNAGGDVYKKAAGSWGSAIGNIGGSVGPVGEKGSIWIVGTGAPSDVTGDDLDMYLNDAIGAFYKKVGGTWGASIGTLTGPTGSAGSTGAAGADAIDGTDGTDGTDGSTILSGVIAPSDVQGVDGDYYLNTDNGDWYKKAAGTWGSPVMNLSGIDGIDGYTIWSAATTPNDVNGIDGDHYLDTDNGDWYQKVAGTWGSAIGNLTGPQGLQGIQGGVGDKGNQGDKGNPGDSMTAGSGAPVDGDFVDDQTYLDTDTGDVYKKIGGTFGAAVGNILGPQGVQGIQGVPGGINWIAVNWALTNDYTKDDALEAGGVAYVCIQTHTNATATTEPGVGATYSTYWDLFASGGAGAVSSVAGRSGAVTLYEADITDFGSYALDSHGHAYDDLTDVAITTPATKHVVVHNGSSWVNRVLVEADISDFGSYSLDSHGHVIADITGLQAELDSKLTSATSYEVNDLTDVQSIAPSNRNALLWDDGDGRYESRAILEADISDFGSYSLDSHGHIIADVTGLQTALDGKLSSTAELGDLTKVFIGDEQPGHILIYTIGGSPGFINRLLLEADISDFGSYAVSSHNHTGVYEPAFSKLGAFNKSFGNFGGTVAEGDHTHDSDYADIAHDHGLDDLNDVAITAPEIGNIIVYAGAGPGWVNATASALGFVLQDAAGLRGGIATELDIRATKSSGTETFVLVDDSNMYLPIGGSNVTISFTLPGSNTLNGVTNFKLSGSILVKTLGNYTGLTLSGLPTDNVVKGSPPATTGEYRILKYEYFKSAAMEFMWCEWTDPGS